MINMSVALDSGSPRYIDLIKILADFRFTINYLLFTINYLLLTIYY